MGQFKPMVKMQTTEPSVELKLKSGGKVEKKMQVGGAPGMAPAMPARGGMMGAAAPMKPSMAARRRAMRAMPAGAAPAAPVGMAAQVMKKGGEAGESKAMHKAEMAKMAKTEKELKQHEAKPAGKAHKGLKTGGVVEGQGGFKTGGVIEGQGGFKRGGGAFAKTKMHEAKPDRVHGTSKNPVKESNAGGYKKGGAAKKTFATGGKVDTGRPVAMPSKPPSKPVSISRLAGTFKSGGKVEC